MLVNAATWLTESSARLLLQIPGLVNVDFADVRTIMSNAGTSLMGQGCASGKGRAREAALQVSQSWLEIHRMRDGGRISAMVVIKTACCLCPPMLQVSSQKSAAGGQVRQHVGPGLHGNTC